jgi:hypothetical protein
VWKPPGESLDPSPFAVDNTIFGSYGSYGSQFALTPASSPILSSSVKKYEFDFDSVPSPPNSPMPMSFSFQPRSFVNFSGSNPKSFGTSLPK